MPLSNDQELTLLLAGTVGLPSPAPATGTLEVVTSDIGDPVTLSDLYLEITHRVSPRMTLVRTVRLDDARVIKAIWPDQAPKSPAEFRIPRQFRAAALARAIDTAHEDPWLTEAVVYLLESSPVLLRVEVGMTAAESADYYPPIDGRGRAPGGGLGTGGGAGEHQKFHALKELVKESGSKGFDSGESFFEFNPCTPGPEPIDPHPSPRPKD